MISTTSVIHAEVFMPRRLRRGMLIHFDFDKWECNIAVDYFRYPTSKEYAFFEIFLSIKILFARMCSNGFLAPWKMRSIRTAFACSPQISKREKNSAKQSGGIFSFHNQPYLDSAFQRTWMLVYSLLGCCIPMHLDASITRTCKEASKFL